MACLLVLGVPGFAAGQGGSAPTTSRDRVLSVDPTAANVAAYRTVVAWDRTDADEMFHLVVDRAGVAADLPVAASVRPFLPSLGPDRHGEPTLAYIRVTRGAARLFRYDLSRGVESEIPVPARPRRCGLITAAIWRGRVAYATADHWVTATRRSRRCPGEVSVATLSGRVLFARRAQVSVTTIALDDSHLAWSTYAGLIVRMWLMDLHAPRTAVVGRDDSAKVDEGTTMTSAAFVGHSLYWLTPHTTNTGPLSYLYRTRTDLPLACSGARRMFIGESVSSLVVDPPYAYYTDETGVRRTTLTTLRFTPGRRGACPQWRSGD